MTSKDDLRVEALREKPKFRVDITKYGIADFITVKKEDEYENIFEVEVEPSNKITHYKPEKNVVTTNDQ